MTRRTPPSDAQSAAASRIETILSRIANSPEDPTLYHQLADAYAEAGERGNALEAYGKAIDRFIALGKAQAAMAVGNKVIRRFPGVTRTHFTLACCALYQGLTRDAFAALDAYVAAALASDTVGMAIPRLRFLGTLTVDRAIRGRIGGLLERLGDDEAHRVSRGDPPAQTLAMHEDKRAELVLEAATWSSDEVWSAFWLK